MKKRLNGAVLMLGVLSIPALGGLILALLDIRQEYISPSQIEANALNPAKMPREVFCTAEWLGVGAALLILGLFVALFIANEISKHKSSQK